MAKYDPYDRGDNPWRPDIDVLDMPRSRPAAKPGAGKAAARPAPAKKKAKSPASRYASTAAQPAQPIPPLDVEPLLAPDRNLPPVPMGPPIPPELLPASQPSEGPMPSTGLLAPRQIGPISRGTRLPGPDLMTSPDVGPYSSPDVSTDTGPSIIDIFSSLFSGRPGRGRRGPPPPDLTGGSF